ncbi:MAG: HNH endonuclease [Devosia sp.]|nr:HNH endonuclease [Devosia sp.]
MSKLKARAPRITARDTRAVRPPPKTVDPHYLTPEHRAWAKAVIDRAGRRCQDAQHDDSRPRQGVRLFADHVVELRDGGAAYDPGNGLTRCGACHTRKTMAERARRMAG